MRHLEKVRTPQISFWDFYSATIALWQSHHNCPAHCTTCCTSIYITTKATTNVGAHPRLVRFPDPHVSRGTRLTHVPRRPFSFSLFFHRKRENIFSKRTQAFVLCTEEHVAQLPIAELQPGWLQFTKASLCWNRDRVYVQLHCTSM